MVDFYNILGVSRDAEDIVIRAAYKALAQKYHPDKWSHNPKLSTERMSEINQAYEILSDSEKRKKYDRNNESKQKKDELNPMATVRGKYIRIIQYLFLVPLIIILLNWAGDINKTKIESKYDKPAEFVANVNEWQNQNNNDIKKYGIKYEDLMGIDYSARAIIDSISVLPKDRPLIELYVKKFEQKYKKSLKFNENLKKEEIVNEIIYESRRFGVDHDLTFGIIETVSGFNQMYNNYQLNAKGLMGVKSAFPEYYKNIDSDFLFIPKFNLRYGLSILRYLLDKRGGNAALALGDYYDINVYDPKIPNLISKNKFVDDVFAKRMYWSDGK